MRVSAGIWGWVEGLGLKMYDEVEVWVLGGSGNMGCFRLLIGRG